jgi:hypothetical protein
MANKIFLWLGLATMLACDGTSNRHPVPYVFVNESVFTNSPSAYDLQFVGGTHVRTDWGHGGLVIYRRTNFGDALDFGAYDLRPVEPLRWSMGYMRNAAVTTSGFCYLTEVLLTAPPLGGYYPTKSSMTAYA